MWRLPQHSQRKAINRIKPIPAARPPSTPTNILSSSLSVVVVGVGVGTGAGMGAGSGRGEMGAGTGTGTMGAGTGLGRGRGRGTGSGAGRGKGCGTGAGSGSGAGGGVAQRVWHRSLVLIKTLSGPEKINWSQIKLEVPGLITDWVPLQLPLLQP